MKGSLQKCPGDYTAGDAEGLAVYGENDIVDSFCYLDNMRSTEGAHVAVSAIVTCAWKKFPSPLFLDIRVRKTKADCYTIYFIHTI